MNLPGPGSGIFWKQYENTTPTFDLTPVEKPDFSPFLLHMTGRHAILSILKGEGSTDQDLPDESGFLKSVYPVNGTPEGSFPCEVVCFTESPLFAVDFFRYRSFRRWNEDQQYGIGFSKSDLVKNHGVRPVVYGDSSLTSAILALCARLEKGSSGIVDMENGSVQGHFEQKLLSIRPLLFPLMEKTTKQGFMWEREWRFTETPGLVFPHSSIKVICCPSEEEEGIRELLGANVDQIQIVQSWREYDAVTDFLKRRELEERGNKYQNIERVTNLGVLQKLARENINARAALAGYSDIFQGKADQLHATGVKGILEELDTYRKVIDKRINEIQQEIKKKAEQAEVKK